ncbi:hypothetical protein SAMN02745248_02758 [Hathewaya proteolytica DSM 3090]|uniref:Uncharacterized protein n=1 Tax=Hathewaya proteolytica DSM 3090 TaxID=1121331 RepID=A0A1M6T8W2_9CLOT|nr:hypothetical protein [Hathewaya proteolytica]SHK53425.1 hypothetical protein SAMN02745248_02758 [Hathewaya proteolytica DSM 3090]
MRSSDEFKALVYSKTELYHDKKKRSNKKVMKYAMTTVVCSFIICFVVNIWQYGGKHKDTETECTTSSDKKESMNLPEGTKSIWKHEHIDGIEIVGKINNEPYNINCNEKEEIKYIMECIDSLGTGCVKEMDNESAKDNEIGELQEDYIVVTIKNQNNIYKKYHIRGQIIKKIVGVLKK